MTACKQRDYNEFVLPALVWACKQQAAMGFQLTK